MDINWNEIEKNRQKRAREINSLVENEDYEKLDEISRKMDKILEENGVKVIKSCKKDEKNG